MKKFNYFLICLSLFSTALVAQNPISMDDFIDKNIHIVTAKSELDTLKISGYDENDQMKHFKVLMKKNEVLGVWTYSWKPTLSILTVPFKVRPAKDTLKQNVTTGLKNAGLNFGIFNVKLDRYFIDEKKSTHKFSAGILIAPSAEELKPSNTENTSTYETKQLFISTAVSLNYTYNDITFSILPLGWDFATTSEGKEYIYNKKRWWGFGIGLSSKLLGI